MNQSLTFWGFFLEIELQKQRVNLELIVADYDRIGSSDPIGKVLLGYNRKQLELKHWKEMIENPRRPIVHWHVLKVLLPLFRWLFLFRFERLCSSYSFLIV